MRTQNHRLSPSVRKLRVATLVLGVLAVSPIIAKATLGGPVLAIDNGVCATPEGNTGQSQCVFTLRLSETSATAVTFNSSLQAGTASAGSDYGGIPASGQIASGELTTTISVPVNGDAIYEADETFTLNLAGVQNATPGSLSATGTITNDDAAPSFTVGNCVVTEGTGGTTACNFPITFAGGAQRTLELSYQTASPGNLLSPVSDASLESPVVGIDTLLYNTGETMGGWAVEIGSTELKSWLHWQPAHYRQSLDLHGNSPGTIARDVATVPGQPYVVSFAFSGHPVCAAVVKTMNASFGGQPLGDFTFDSTGFTPENMGWRYESVEVTANAAVSRLRFASTTAGGCGPALDDIAVTPVGAASSGVDFAPASRHYEDPVILAQGVTAHTVTVNVIGDTTIEADEDFELQVCVADGECQTAVGGIDDDEGAGDSLFANGFE